MTHHATGKRMAILAADGFEESELFSPREAIEGAGGAVEVVSLKTGEIQGMRHMEPGRRAQVNRTLKDARPEEYDAILIPGGLFSPDKLRTDRDALRFAGTFLAHRKPVFAICHGPQVLISAGMVAGRTMTAVKAVQKDLENAGANVKDQAVVDDHGLVTSRTPDDLDAFNAAILKEIVRDAADRHEGYHKWAMF